MTNWGSTSRRSVLLGMTSLCAGMKGRALAEPGDAEFFKGKTVTVVTSTGPGGGYDLMARILSRHMPKYLPGLAGMVVQNMPGGGNVRAANYMYEIAPKDGTIIGVLENGVPLKQVLDSSSVRFDASKFNWIGSPGGHNEIVIALRSTGIRSIGDLQKKEIVLGGTGPGSSIVIYAAAMNHVLGTKFKIVTGYTSSTDVFLAMDRGEVFARSGTYASIVRTRPDWIKEDRIVLLTQVGLKKDSELPQVPLLRDLVTTPTDRAILTLISSPAALGQPYFAPPGVPAGRLAVLKAAFQAVMRDPDFMAEASKAQADLSPIDGTDVAAIVDAMVSTPPDVVTQARAAISLDENGPR